VDENETLFDAAHRELHEETGVVISDEDERLGSVVISGITFYVYTTNREIPVEDAKIDDSEVAHAEWVSQSKIIELDANRSLVNYFTYHYQTKEERQATLERREARKTVVLTDIDGFAMKTKKTSRQSRKVVEEKVIVLAPLPTQNVFGTLGDEDEDT